MKKFSQLVEEQASSISEIFPWDLEEKLQENPDLMILDIREQDEWDAMHIAGSIHVPRGILESACEYDYDETVPSLVNSRDKEVVVVCRSGLRSVLAAFTLKLMGFNKPISLKTGLRGWNDYEQPLVDGDEKPVDIDDADQFFESHLREDQLDPSRRTS